MTTVAETSLRVHLLALLWMVAKSVSAPSPRELLDFPVNTNKQLFQPWFQLGAKWFSSIHRMFWGWGSCDFFVGPPILWFAQSTFERRSNTPAIDSSTRVQVAEAPRKVRGRVSHLCTRGSFAEGLRFNCESKKL